jgi:glycogen operon protein
VRDRSFLLLFNAHRGPMIFTVPDSRYGAVWEVVVDTATAAAAAATGLTTVAAGGRVELAARSILVLRGDDPA